MRIPSVPRATCPRATAANTAARATSTFLGLALASVSHAAQPTVVSAPFEVVHAFASTPKHDGASPVGGLTLSPDGRVVGTTFEGGVVPRGYVQHFHAGGGTLFSVDPVLGETVLVEFPTQSNGVQPTSGLVGDAQGNLYFAPTYSVSAQGPAAFGELSRLEPDGNLTPLHVFEGPDGAYPTGTLVLGADGLIYGITQEGGALDAGTVYRVAPDGSGFTVLHSFGTVPGDGQNPTGGVVRGADGSLYGVTVLGGSTGVGTAWRIDASGHYAVIHTFTGAPDGAEPDAALTFGGDGLLYGTTAYGGANNLGLVFRMSTDGAIEPRVSFSDGLGIVPEGGLLLAADGDLYGTTSALSEADCGGTLYRLSVNGDYELLHIFHASASACAAATAQNVDGIAPTGTLAQATDGSIYGTASAGGRKGWGTVWKIQPPTVTAARKGSR